MFPFPCKLILALALSCLFFPATRLNASVDFGHDHIDGPADDWPVDARVAMKQWPPASRVEAYRQHLEVLTSAEMGGRGTGSPGGHKAIAYIEEQMRLLGLATFATYQGSFRQEFSLADPRPARYWRLDSGLSWTGNQAAGSDSEPIALPFRFSKDADLKSGLAFVGYGLRIPELGIDEYSGLDVAGKVVLVLRGAPGKAWRNGLLAEYGQELRFSKKIANAEAAGALGFLLVDPRTDLEPEREDAMPHRALTARGESNLAALWLSRQTAEDLLAGSGQSLNERRAAIDQLALDSSSDSRGVIDGRQVHLRVRMKDPRPDLHTANLVGVMCGRDPELRHDYIVIGAHHDHLGRGAFGSLAKNAVGRVHPGADDNASGLAAMLMLIERLADGEKPFTRRSLLFVAFGAEELGLHGSRYFLENSPVPHKKISVMINLDMVGRAGGDRLRIEGVASGVGLADLLEQTCSDSGRSLRVRAAASPRSDHWSFLQAGIPALFLNSGSHEHYHRPSDVAELIEVVPALQVVEVVRDLIEKLDALDRAPNFSPEGMRRDFLRPVKKK